jgi:hypothetical protein
MSKKQQNKTSANNYMPKEKFGNHIAWMHYVGVLKTIKNMIIQKIEINNWIQGEIKMEHIGS